MNPKGYFAIGIYKPKREVNVGSLLRCAGLYEASFVFTVGARYKRQASDTPNTPLHTPLFHFDTIEDVLDLMPWSCELVGVELDDNATPLPAFEHPTRAAYLLGAEDNGLPRRVIDKCHRTVSIPCPSQQSMNVSAAGSIVIYDRFLKTGRPDTGTEPK